MKKNKKVMAITLGIVCMILAYSISIQIKTVRSINLSVADTETDNGLRDQVLKAKEKYEDQYKEFEKTEAELKKIRESSTKDSDEAAEVEKEIKDNNLLLGLTDVEGKGVVITLKDNSEVTSDTIGDLDSIEYYLVHAMDIRAIINELKNAGAEAICINNQRIISTSAITCEGNVIKINGEKIGSPFVIKAIGSPELLYGLSRPGGYIELLNETGVVAEINKDSDIKIPKYSGIMNFKYSRVLK